MKRFITMILILSLILTQFAFAEPKIGEHIGDVLETDIVATINGYKIPSTNIANKMAVYARDLRNYGFIVEWKEAEREVHISFNPDQKFTPMSVVDKVYTKIGKKAGDVLYTDIKTFLNGKEIKAMNVNNATAIYFRDLSVFGVISWDEKARISNLSVKSNISGWYTPVPELALSDEEIWGRDDINNLTYKDVYEVRNGKLIFTQEPYFKDYELKTELNPDINRMVYDLTKSLISDNHYVITTYVPGISDSSGYTQPNIAHVALSKDAGYAFNSSFFFHFWFHEDKPANVKQSYKYDKFSDKAIITLDLSKLWWSFNEDGSRYNPSIDGWVQDFYADKLKKSFIVLFGENTGIKVYDYVVDMYIKARISSKDIRNKRFTTTIDNIQVDLPTDDSANLWFYFSISK